MKHMNVELKEAVAYLVIAVLFAIVTFDPLFSYAVKMFWGCLWLFVVIFSILALINISGYIKSKRKSKSENNE